MLRILTLLLALSALPASASVSVEIDLQEQRAYLLRNRRVVLASPISSGRAGYHTTAGRFKITQKSVNHTSSLYGKIIDGRGRTVVADADKDMATPPGGRFVNAPMYYFMRYNGAEGMHAGYLPGYPASHGCVRLPREKAIAFFNAVEIGTPVTVFGRTPRGRPPQEEWRPQERLVRDYPRPYYEQRPRRWWPFGG